MTPDEREEAFARLKAAQAEQAKAEEGKLFMGIPDRWYERFTVICPKGHVSRMVIKSEVHGDMCPACMGPCVMTAPETIEASADGETT